MPPKKIIAKPNVTVLIEIPQREEISLINNELLVMFLKGMIRMHEYQLQELEGRKTGFTQFPYSESMKNAGFNWTEKQLFMFLKNLSEHVVEQERADLIAYLFNN